MLRREYLAITGSIGAAALPGCISNPGSGGEDTNRDDEGENAKEPARIRFSGGDTDSFDVREGEEFTLEAYLENKGEETGRETVTLSINGEGVDQEDVVVEGSEEVAVSFEVDSSNLEPGNLGWEFSTEDDSLTGGEIYLLECPDKSELPPYGGIEGHNLTEGGVKRADLDIRLLKEGDDISDEELIKIAQRAVCVFTEEEAWNAISLTLWEQGQYPGREQAYGECVWAPNGVWSQAGDVETGDYSTHEYNVRRF